MSNYVLFLWCYFVYAYAPYQGRFQGGRRGPAAPPWAFLKFCALLIYVWRPPERISGQILHPPERNPETNPPNVALPPRVYFETYCVSLNERTVKPLHTHTRRRPYAPPPQRAPQRIPHMHPSCVRPYLRPPRMPPLRAPPHSLPCVRRLIRWTSSIMWE